MLAALLEVVIDAIVAAGGWLARVLRGAVGSAAADAAGDRAADRMLEGMSPTRRERRRMRRRFRALARAGETGELVGQLRRLGKGDDVRDLRIDAIVALTGSDPAAAEPVLRAVLEEPDDPYVVVAALDRIAKHRMTALADAVAVARDDPRPLVRDHAGWTYGRLVGAEGRRSGAVA